MRSHAYQTKKTNKSMRSVCVDNSLTNTYSVFSNYTMRGAAAVAAYLKSSWRPASADRRRGRHAAAPARAGAAASSLRVSVAPRPVWHCLRSRKYIILSPSNSKTKTAIGPSLTARKRILLQRLELAVRPRIAVPIRIGRVRRGGRCRRWRCRRRPSSSGILQCSNYGCCWCSWQWRVIDDRFQNSRCWHRRMDALRWRTLVGRVRSGHIRLVFQRLLLGFLVLNEHKQTNNK